MAQDPTDRGASRENAGSGAAERREDGHRPPLDREPLPTCVQGLPPLPESFRRTLDVGLTSLGSPPLAEGALERIEDHVRLLLAWNRAINLTGIRDPEAMATGNVLDSLAALPLLREAGVEEFVDLGSGAGYPGLPLAVTLPARRALLVDSVAKKARFLDVAVEALGLAGSVEVAATRSESLAADSRHRARWRAVVARAVADLGELAELALPLLRPRGILVAWKRRPVEEELAGARPLVAAVGGRIAAVHEVALPGLDEHLLVVVEKTGRTPSRYPRPPAARRAAR